MLKLMKYEFRKLRTTLVALLLAMLALELGFVLGNSLDKVRLTAVCLVLLTLLAFAAYGYVLVAGVVSYSRELKDRTGYLVFMTPVRPIGVVLSKLLTTLLAAVVLTVLFGTAAWLDYAYMARIHGVNASLVDEINLMLQVVLGDAAFNLRDLWSIVLYTGLSVFIEIMLMMCTAYLAITVSATLLQNRKGFLRALVSVVLFGLLTWGATWLTGKVTDLVPRLLPAGAQAITSMDTRTLTAMLWASLGLHLVLGAVFAIVSASLLKRKVSL